MKKKIFSFFVFILVISNFIFALPGFSSYLKDVSGDYVYYRDYSFVRESYVGFLMYDEGTYAARYFAPKTENAPAKEVKILFTVNTGKNFMELTGEKIISAREADDAEIVNYLHDMIYELNGRRIKAGDVNPTNVVFSDDELFLRQGKIVNDEFMQFGGDVKVVYDFVVPLFNVKAVYDYSGCEQFEVVTIGRLSSSEDKSFDGFVGFNEGLWKNQKSKVKKYKACEAVEYKTADGQKLLLDSAWNNPMESLWMRGDDAVAFIGSYFGDENIDLAFFVREMLLNPVGIYSNWKSLFVKFDNKAFDKAKSFEMTFAIEQNNKLNRNFKVVSCDSASEKYSFFVMSVYEDAYKKNSKYYNEIVKSYSDYLK